MKTQAISLAVACLLLAQGTNLGTVIVDDFGDGADGWSPATQGGWSVVQTAPGQYAYRADLVGETLSAKTNVLLGASWRLELDMKFQGYYADSNKRALAAIALFPTNSGVQLLADVQQLKDGSVSIDTAWFDTTNQVWHGVLSTGWMPGSAPSYHLQLTRLPGSDHVVFSAISANGFSFRASSKPIPILDQMRVPGFRANWAKVDFSHLQISTSFELPAISTQPASKAAVVGENAAFSVQATGTAPLAYQWRKDGQNVAGANDAVFTVPSLRLADAGRYDVLVSNDGGSVVSATAVLTICNPAPNWIQWPVSQGGNGHYYSLTSQAYMRWFDAEAEAKFYNAHLLSITSEMEQKMVERVFLTSNNVQLRQSFWIGLNDLEHSGQFTWTTGEPLSFTDWYPGEPSPTEQAVAINWHFAFGYGGFGTWNNFPIDGIDSRIVANSGPYLGIIEATNNPQFTFQVERSRFSSALGFRLKLLSISPGTRIDVSSDLLTWEPLFGFPNTSDEEEIIDASAISHPWRFYRAVAP